MSFRTSLSVVEHRYERQRILNVSHTCNSNKSRPVKGHLRNMRLMAARNIILKLEANEYWTLLFDVNIILNINTHI